MRRVLILFLSLTFLLLFFAEAEETPDGGSSQIMITDRQEPDPITADDTVRVLLQSLGARQALGITLDGSYSVNGDRGFQFERGTELALGLDGGNIILAVGGAAIDMGSGFTLRRHLDDQGAGAIYIHEAAKYNPYPGDMTFSVYYGSIRVICTLRMEDYLCGVVPYEMSDTFPLEALKAQAVAARSYTMSRIVSSADKAYDLVDTTNDQVYFGLDERFELPIRAVRETAGLVCMSGDTYCTCFYTASNGGQTALPSDVWSDMGHSCFAVTDDPYDLANPESISRTAFLSRDVRQIPEALYSALVDALGAVLMESEDLSDGDAIGISKIVSIEPGTLRYAAPSRQYDTVRFTVVPIIRRLVRAEDGSTGYRDDTDPEKTVEIELPYYTQVRTALGIGINAMPYDLFEITESDYGFTFTARRYGHGVGMSQRGAQRMAGVEDWDFRQILSFYYPGAALVRINWDTPALTRAAALPDSLGYAAPMPTPAPTPAPLRALREGEYYAFVSVEGVDSTLNIRQEPTLSASIVGVLRNGTRMIILDETDDGWGRMETAEYSGYVKMSFVRREE